MKESEYLEGQHHLVEKIKLIPLFSRFDDTRLQDLLRLCKIRIYEPSEIIIREGEEERCMYFIFSGRVQVSKGGKPVSKLCRTGDVFGEMSLVDDSPRSATVRALEETTCFAVDAAQLEKFEGDEHGRFHAAIYKMFAQFLAQRLRATTENYLKVRKELDQLKKRGRD